jgi:hypothetical protein
MADPTYPRTDDLDDTGGDTEERPDGGPPRTGMPRWVKVSGIVAGALVLLFVILQLTGLGGDHGPGRHMGDDDQEQGDDGGLDPSDWDH